MNAVFIGSKKPICSRAGSLVPAMVFLLAMTYSHVSNAANHSYHWSARELKHQLGYPGGEAWVADEKSGLGFMTFGPQVQNLPTGHVTVEFELLIANNDSDDAVVAKIDGYDASKDKILSTRIIRRRDFEAPNRRQFFDLELDVPIGAAMEFRIYSYGLVRLQAYSINVVSERLTLTALWRRRAHFEFRYSTDSLSTSFHDGFSSSVTALDGTWFAFNRMQALSSTAEQVAECNRAMRPLLQVVVRSSVDQGKTWSDPIVVISPSPERQSADYCEVVDGDGFFDSQTDTWHYIGQCINDTGKWNMCHYSLSGDKPTSRFVADPANPVVRGGAIWSQICSQTKNGCPGSMQDEGTPQIIGKSIDGIFYVTFHGANYSIPVTGARGIARTRDFVNWQVDGPELPKGPILSPQDCSQWHVKWAKGGCIGEGNARILKSGGYFYMLAEAADKGLTCQSGQNWVLGLLRNTSLGGSGSWQNFDANPFVINDNTSPQGCALQYMNFIRDRGDIYLEFNLYTPVRDFPGYVYQLTSGRGRSDVMQVK